MKTNIHANIGIEIEFHKLIKPYFSNFHCFISISGLFASDLITLHYINDIHTVWKLT